MTTEENLSAQKKGKSEESILKSELKEEVKNDLKIWQQVKSEQVQKYVRAVAEVQERDVFEYHQVDGVSDQSPLFRLNLIQVDKESPTLTK